MAHITTTAPHSAAGFFHGLGNRILSFLTAIAESNSRMREAERLNAMSDAELARIGLKREDIARHVFRDMYYV
ncbi:DUF1127 domain-containing protein [Citreimonas salinaria]|uniref:DUF1127 domain-containing protein n=1 Tax=Citreimonas salinaria TaxID=321339 RepID=A0A1H3HQQ6_9RHOB|nr:DUF1127 domain-containing protein [Citreimonas salinaria]SDY17856.1 protein of unknown function [Citreimonas salinaria]